MKSYLSTALALACAVLVVSFILMKRSDDTRRETDASALADLSNQLISAQMQITAGNGTILTLTNHLDESRSAATVFSNQLTEAQSAVALDAEQITNLNQRVAEMEAENQTLNRRAADLNNQTTNQIAGLTSQLALTRTNLDQANKDYALLENRLRRDVAERLVVERKFRNVSELKAQIENLQQWSPAQAVSADSIYAGLDVEVKSNSFHVIAPN